MTALGDNVEEAAFGDWLIRRFRPGLSWITFGLLAATIILIVWSTIEVGWVPEDKAVIYSGLLGLVMATYLANRDLSGRWAWAIIACYGLILNVIWIGQLLPSLAEIISADLPAAVLFRQNAALMIDKIGGWWLAVINGARTEETITFAFLLSLAAWFLAAFAAWSIYRWRRPFPAVMVLSLALAVNTFYGRAPLWPVSLFIGLVILLIAFVEAANLESGWNQRGVDYPDDVQMDLLFATGGLMLLIVAISIVVPVINFRAISRAVSSQPLVQEFEDAWDRIFAGVQQPQPDWTLSQPPGSSGPSSLPRSFLIGDPPELSTSVAFRAEVDQTPSSPVHWRSATFDIYTGLGWSTSSERAVEIGPHESIPISPGLLGAEVQQTIFTASDPGTTRTTLGLPLQFDQTAVTWWRGIDDLSRTTGEGGDYSAISHYVRVDVHELRQATLDAVPPSIKARYTELPDTVPDRVHQLAHEIAGDPELTPAPYDQAKAIEGFLRQYPYSLDVELPPDDADPVDFFLFDLQQGYCDYYASAMVVLARSIGLPARLGVGYLIQPVGEDGLQTVTFKNAHSWAELFFAGFGWVEFEPTAAFPSDTRSAASDQDISGNDLGQERIPPPLPESPAQGWSAWWLLSLLILVVPLAFLVRWRFSRSGRRTDNIRRAYGRLLYNASKLDLAMPPSQTPKEFKSALLSYLADADQQWPANLLHTAKVIPEITMLTAAFERRQYGGHPVRVDNDTRFHGRLWRQLWLLRMLNRIRRLTVRLPNP